MIQNVDYWTENYLRGVNRPPHSYYHPSMPTKKLCHALGTIWYEITQECSITWKNSRYDYPGGMIVYERRSKPVGIVNYDWIRRQKGYDKNNSRGWINP